MAFWGCEKLTSITIPDSVGIVRESAFERCGNLTVRIPPRTYVEEKAFEGVKEIVRDNDDGWHTI